MRVAAEAFHFEIAKPGVATQSTGCALGEDIRRMIERKAVTLSLDRASGFELADVGPAAIKVLR